MTKSTPSEEQARFWRNVIRHGDNACWGWSRSLSTHGYGQFWYQGKIWRAHRLAWFLTHGPIPKGQCICHRCDNPVCSNPAHMFLGTQRENMRDMLKKQRHSPPPIQLGRRNHRARLTEQDARAIRVSYANGASLRQLGARYGVSHTAIASVLKRRTWAHVR